MANKRILIISDYERIVPPFMQTLIRYAVDKFDHIYYVTPPIPEHYSKTILYENLTIRTWSNTERLRQYISGILSPLRFSFWKELAKGRISFGAIKNIGELYFCSDGFINLTDKYVSYALKNDIEVFVLATWMNVDALVAARLKKKYPNIKSYALAHSGEVMAERNPYLHQCFHEFKHQYLDTTYFISKKVLNGYYQAMADSDIKNKYGNRIKVRYLGSIKNSNMLNPDKTGDYFELLSCSRIDANKRLDSIISALKKWDGVPIRWTHIGTGVMENDVKAHAQELMSINPRVKVHFTGRIDNSDVIRYYAEKHVDLFLNVSKSEGLPISIMEAMSYGIPCAATDVGGTSEIVNQTNGYILNSDFTDSDLIDVLNNYISLPSHEKKEMRVAAMNTWYTKFNAETNAKELFNEWFN